MLLSLLNPDAGAVPTGPYFVSSSGLGSSFAATTTATVTVPAPASIATGNLLVAIVANSKGNSGTDTYASFAPSGWTKQVEHDTSTAGSDADIALWTKSATDSEPSTYAFGYTCSTAQTQYVTVAVLQYGNAAIGPVAVAASSPLGTASTNYTAPAVSPTAAAGFDVVAWTNHGGSAITAPAGVTVRQNLLSNGNYVQVVGDVPFSAAGSSGTFAATGASDTFAAVTFAVIPAPSTVALAGAGDLSVTSAPAPTQAPQLTGSGTLAVPPGVVDLTAVPAPSLSGSGTLAVPTQVPAPAGRPQLTGSGTLAAPAPTPKLTQTAQLAGAGSMFTTAFATVAVPYTDTFSGSTWPAAWRRRGSNDGTMTSRAGTGEMVTPTFYAGSAVVAELSTAALGDTDVLTSVTADWGSTGYAGIYLNGDGTVGSGVNFGDTSNWYPQNSYAFELNMTGGFKLYQVTGDTKVQVASAAYTYTASTKYNIRVTRQGSSLTAKVWLATAAESTATTASYTITGTPLTGTVGLVAADGGNSKARFVDWDDFTVSVPVPAYSSSPQLSGAGSLTVSPLPALTPSSQLTGAGVLTANGVAATTATGGHAKAYTASGFDVYAAKVYDGSTFVTGVAKYWDGTQWTPVSS